MGESSSGCGTSSGCLLSTVLRCRRSKLCFSSLACWSTMNRSLPRRAMMKPRLNCAREGNREQGGVMSRLGCSSAGQ